MIRSCIPTCVLVIAGLWVTPTRGQERTVFAYKDNNNRMGCFVHLQGPNWMEWTGTGDNFRFKEVGRGDGRIELHDQSRGGVGVLLFVSRSEWKAKETKGKWSPLWDGSWTTLVDLRTEFKQMGLTPTRQGERGTCSVFVTNSALEYAFSRYQGKQVRFSVEYLNWAGGQVLGQPSDGGFFHNLLAGFDKFGVCHAALMPYTAKFNPGIVPSKEAKLDAKRVRAAASKNNIHWHWIRPLTKKQGLKDAEMHQIKGVMARGWPVAAGSDHSRLLVGFQDDHKKPGGGVFVVLDSATGRFEEVTYQFIKAKVDDVFWIEVVFP